MVTMLPKLMSLNSTFLYTTIIILNGSLLYQLLTDKIPDITDSDEDVPYQSAANPPPGTTSGEWFSLGKNTKYPACKEKRCFLKK